MRPTRDIDFLATISNDVETATEIIRGICSHEVEDDGILFDPKSVQGRIIKEDADYEGVRVTFLGHLQKARIHMQVDMGFADVTVPPPIDLDYPTLLDFDTPRIRGYARETMIAEKFEAMVALGEMNSRVRDFFDVWLLSRQFDFQGRSLAAAIEATFRNRGRPLSTRPVALTRRFAADSVKQSQWAGFLRKAQIPATLPFQEVVQSVADFILPVVDAVGHGATFAAIWKAPGPWRLPTI
jgi:hypothetical protein